MTQIPIISGGTPAGGSGGTNFVPPPGSPLKNRTTDTPLSHDLAGVSRGTGTTSTGAYV